MFSGIVEGPRMYCLLELTVWIRVTASARVNTMTTIAIFSGIIALFGITSMPKLRIAAMVEIAGLPVMIGFCGIVVSLRLQNAIMV